MAKKNNGIDTDFLFRTITAQGDLKKDREAQSTPVKEPVKKTPVQIYLTPETALQLRLQGAAKVKEKDKTAIAMAAIEIILALSDDTYAAAKQRAEEEGTSVGDVVEKALQDYLL